MPRWEGYSRALPLRFVPAFPPKAVAGASAPQKEWEAAVRAVQVQAWAYAVCVLAGYRAWGYDRHPRFARGVWWRGAPRWSLHTLWRGYQQALHQSPAVHPTHATARGTWAEMEAWLHQMDALGAAALVA